MRWILPSVSSALPDNFEAILHVKSLSVSGITFFLCLANVAKVNEANFKLHSFHVTSKKIPTAK